MKQYIYIKILLTCVVLFFTFYGTSQNQLRKKTTMLRVVYEFSQKALNEGKTFSVIDTMVLDINTNNSVYYDRNLRAIDSVKKVRFDNIKKFDFSTDKNDLEQRLLLKSGRSDEIIGGRVAVTEKVFKNRGKNEIVTLDRDNEDLKYKFRVVENIIYNWKIMPDTTTIIGYSCTRATTEFRGRRYNAWFTMDIPSNDGPWKFMGLPGLILRVEDTDGVFNMKAIGLENIDNFVFTIKNTLALKFETITYKELNKYKQNKNKKISYGFYESNGVMKCFYNINNPITYPNIEIE